MILRILILKGLIMFLLAFMGLHLYICLLQLGKNVSKIWFILQVLSLNIKNVKECYVFWPVNHFNGYSVI